MLLAIAACVAACGEEGPPEIPGLPRPDPSVETITLETQFMRETNEGEWELSHTLWVSLLPTGRFFYRWREEQSGTFSLPWPDEIVGRWEPVEGDPTTWELHPDDPAVLAEFGEGRPTISWRPDPRWPPRQPGVPQAGYWIHSVDFERSLFRTPKHFAADPRIPEHVRRALRRASNR